MLRQQQDQLKQIKELKQKIDREVARNNVSTESTTPLKTFNGNTEKVNDNMAMMSPVNAEHKKCDR